MCWRTLAMTRTRLGRSLAFRRQGWRVTLRRDPYSPPTSPQAGRMWTPQRASLQDGMCEGSHSVVPPCKHPKNFLPTPGKTLDNFASGVICWTW